MTRRTLQSILLVAVAALALMSARVSGAQQAGHRRLAFAARPIARGAVLGADDIEYRDSTTSAPADTNQVVVGWVTRRMIVAGEVLRSPAVTPPVIVMANESVEVEWTDQNVRLTVRGIATRSAALGERVPVRIDSGKRMDALVVAPGRVRIE